MELCRDGLKCVGLAHDWKPQPELSVVVPCYNEAEVLPRFKERLLRALEQLDQDWEVIFIDDGSRDCTFAQLTAMHWEEPRFKAISLSRNFGHQTAISAGLRYACGEVVAVMDADLQDPPELLGPCLAKLQEGYDVVYAVRRQRKESLFKRAAYALFYRLLRLLADFDIPSESGDFCVMSRRVVDVLRQMPERDYFVRGLRAWVGFRQIGIEYDRPERAAGKTKYSLKKLVGLAADGIFSFSVLPLRAAICSGILAVGVAVSWAVLHLAWRIGGFRLMGHTAGELPGWTTLMCGMFLLGGLQLLIMGFVGEYVGRIYMEVKQRPRWVIGELLGFESRERERVGRGKFAGVNEDNRSTL